MRQASLVRLLAVLLALALALAVTACGGGGGDEGGAAPPPSTVGGGGGDEGGGDQPGVSVPGAIPEGAQLAPADVPLFLAFDTNFDSEQWQTVDTLLQLFPEGDTAMAKLFEQISGGEGVDVETELKPAFGPETDIVLLELDTAQLESPTNAPIVLMTKPADGSKLEALLAKGDDTAVFQVTDDGWYVVADNQEIIDGFLAGGATSSLASAPGFAEDIQALPGDALARLYLNGAPLVAALQQSLTESASAFDLSTLGGLGSFGVGGNLQSVTLAVRAEAGGLGFQGASKTQGAPTPAVYQPTLQSVAPSGALLFVSFANLGASLQPILDLAAQQTPDFEQQLGQLEAGLGVSLENDVLPLFEGEQALYLRSAVPVPEITLLLSPADPVKGLATLDKLTAAIALFAGSSSGTPTVTTTSIAGIPAKQLSFPGSDFSVYYAQVGQNLVFTTAVQGIADLAAPPSGHLADDPLFQEAIQKVGVAGGSQGFVYASVREGLSLIDALEELSSTGISQEDLQYVRPIEYLIVAASAAQDVATFSGFLSIG